MKHEEFISRIGEWADIGSREQSERAAVATLTALGQHLTQGELDDLADQLPEPIGERVREAEPTRQAFSMDDFFEKVQRYESVGDRAVAEKHARAVMGVVSDAVTRGELEDVFSQLPNEFRDLLAPKG